jgi:hypothetical protein
MVPAILSRETQKYRCLASNTGVDTKSNTGVDTKSNTGVDTCTKRNTGVDTKSNTGVDTKITDERKTNCEEKIDNNCFYCSIHFKTDV